MSIKISSISSPIPGWYDPALPGFSPPKTWDGTHVRIRVPVADWEDAQQKAARRYPKAILHLVPEAVETPEIGVLLDPTRSDESLLEDYLKDRSLPPETTAGQVVAYLLSRIPQGGFGVKGLKFGKVSATDTLCFRSAELDLSLPGMTLVTGVNRDWGGRSNGAGKSTILALPMLALFGETPKGQSHDAWRRNDADGPSKVVLEFQTPDGKPAVISRRRNPPGLDFQIDGKDYSGGSIPATQKAIESVTGLTPQVASSSLYIGQREVGIILTGTNKERKELFSRFLGLERFLMAQERVRTDAKKLEREIERCSEDLALVEQSLQETKGAINQLKGAVLAVDPKEEDRIQKEIQSLRGEVDRLTKDRLRHDPWLEENQKRFEAYLDISSRLEGRIESLREQLEKAAAVAAGRCPLCGGRVSVATMESHTQELEEEIARCNTDLDEAERKQSLNRKKRKEVQDKIQEIYKALYPYESKIREKEAALSRVREALEAERRVAAIRERYEKKLADQERNLAIHRRCLEVYEMDRAFYQFCLAVVGRDGLPMHLCASVCPALNGAAARLSEALADSALRVRFELLEEEIDVQVENPHGGRAVADQSQGELRMVGLITVLAFREVLAPHGLLILDEPGEGLDSVNAKAFAAGLNRIVSRFGAVFVTTHNGTILATLEPDHQLEVEKKDGVSHVKRIF
jgi:DNA repair exonuclease SbcCD ATPase subunit